MIIEAHDDIHNIGGGSLVGVVNDVRLVRSMYD